MLDVSQNCDKRRRFSIRDHSAVSTGTPTHEGLVRDLASGAFIASQRNAVLVGDTGAGKTDLAIAIARACIRSGARFRCFNTVDLVNRREAETKQGRQGRMPTT